MPQTSLTQNVSKYELISNVPLLFLQFFSYIKPENWESTLISSTPSHLITKSCLLHHLVTCFISLLLLLPSFSPAACYLGHYNFVMPGLHAACVNSCIPPTPSLPVLFLDTWPFYLASLCLTFYFPFNFSLLLPSFLEHSMIAAALTTFKIQVLC